jgi:hypothetical protein
MSTDVAPRLSPEGLLALVETVQRNCDFSDAFYAQDMSLCAYLLDMREQYRWAHGMAFGEPIPREQVSHWITSLEARWDTLRADDVQRASRGYVPLPGTPEIHAFEQELANSWLAPSGLVYGAGLGRMGRPIFFLGECVRREMREGLSILVTDRELARGMTAPPAVSRDATVLVRLDAMRRWLWVKGEEWGERRPDNPVARAVAGRRGDEAFAAIDRLARKECESLILHEVGEHRAGELLGEDWEDMLDDLHSNRKAEFFARAVRDLLADCLVTLPTLVERGEGESIEFWFANLEGMRRDLSPALLAAHTERGADLVKLKETAKDGVAHWKKAGKRLIAAWAREGPVAVERLWINHATLMHRA